MSRDEYKQSAEGLKFIKYSIRVKKYKKDVCPNLIGEYCKTNSVQVKTFSLFLGISFFSHLFIN